MTYGENTEHMRESMVLLLGWHRIQQRLGGGGSHTIPATTGAERERMGQIIQRYRRSALTWCLQAVTATTPKIDVPQGRRRSATELRDGLDAAVTAAGTGEPSSQLLAVHHGNHLLAAWQRLARSAVIGEHDFGAGVNASLTPEQANTVLNDAANLTRGLVLLDRRYANVPGWTHLKQPSNLNRTAEATAILTRESGVDATVDARGWRPPAGRIDGPMLPGVAGAAQAQYNLLVELGRFPHALNLRRVLHSQAQVCHEAAKRAATAAPDLFTRFSARELLYRDLTRASRDLGGLVGGGGWAVVESQNAASRLQQVHETPSNTRKPLQDLHRLMTRTDARVTAIIERGFSEQLYFISVNYPRLLEGTVRAVHPPRQRWLPVASPVQTDLLPLVRERLRPSLPKPAAAPTESLDNRHAYEKLLALQPGMRSRSGPNR